MGFKKTSEGRVYFQGADGEDINQGSARKPGPSNSNRNSNRNSKSNEKIEGLTQGTPHTQMQIVTLLKTLNERLKITQAERNKMAHELEAYRGLIEDLQDKSDRSEKAYIALEQKLSKTGASGGQHAEILARDALKELEETRALLHDLENKATRADRGVSALKKMQVDQAEKMAVSINHAAALTKRLKDTETRQEQIGARVDDAISQQGRLTRKIDKAIEERTRFMRKLERIEETVLQTRDSLNAKAMVLLTEQGVAAQTDVDFDQMPPQSLAADLPPKTVKSADQESRTLQMIGIGLFVIAGLLGAWLISELRAPQVEAPTTLSQAETNVAQTQTQAAPPPAEIDMTSMEWSIQQDTSAFNDAPEAQTTAGFEPAQVNQQNDDIGALDLNNEAQVEALLSGNPDAVAAALNGIEPGTAMPENVIAPTTQAALTPADTQAEAPQAQPEPQEAAPPPAAPTPQAPAPEEPSQPDVQAATPQVQDPRALTKADSGLPDVVKAIEDQAFNGVAEAQHDLAAIYTAGHGGVRQNYERAAFWFEQAASNGVGNAAYNLGVLHHQGLGVKTDLSQAISWYKNAAERGHPEAQYNLGIAYIEGIGVPYDAEQAAQYFQSAAQNNIMEAAYNLGLIYENGLLGEAEPDKALVWYKTAADQGSPEAQQALEQLAKSLNVSIDEVNGLAESMMGKEKSEATSASTTQSAAAIQPASGTAPQPQAQNEAGLVRSVVASEQIVVAQIQEYLMRMGLYPGPADGIMGPLTEDAIRSYQRLHNLNADGKAGDLLLSHMLANVISADVMEQGSRAQ